jgi:hypothetical protein
MLYYKHINTILSIIKNIIVLYENYRGKYYEKQ